MEETVRIDDTALEERLGYKFSARELLERALTHSSAVP
ncbi:MAG: ribonuclease III, partial [Acidobacteria bacterium]